MGSGIDELVRRNERFALGFRARAREASPDLRVAVLTCMDARIVTSQALGLAEGDVHIIRNAGGIVTDDVIRSLCISQAALGTREIMVVMHTECGLGALPEADLRELVAGASGSSPDFPLGAFEDLDITVRSSLRRLRESSVLVERDRVRGFVYDVGLGSLREVV